MTSPINGRGGKRMSVVEESGHYFFQTPWKNIFLWHFMEVEREALIATPTMDTDLLRKIQSILIARSKKKMAVRLLLRFSEADFITKGIDPEVLRILALLLGEPNSNMEIRFLPNLSLCAIVMDGKKAIIATGDLSSDQLLNDIGYGHLIIGKDMVDNLLEDMNALWERSTKVSSEEILDYMVLIKERSQSRVSHHRPESGPSGTHAWDLVHLGSAIEPLGKDRPEPHLEETKKITRELLVRAREALEGDTTETALFYIEEGLVLDSDNPDLLLEKGKVLYGSGQYEKAISCFNRVLDKNEENRDAWAYSGMCHHELSDIEEALYSYDQATDIDPQYYPVWIKKGIIMGKTKGREEDGLKCLEYALTQDPYNEEAWFNKAQILEQRLSRMEESILAYRSLLRINPNHVVGSFRMGLISYKKLKDVKKAKKYFDKVVEADPTHIHAWMFKSEIAEKVEGDIEASLQFLENAREANPEAHEILHRIIDMHLRCKRELKDTIQVADELLLLRPHDPLALYVSGLGALHLKNDPNKALEFMNESIRSDPKNISMIISKANILAEHLDRTSEAVTLLKNTIKRNNQEPELWKELGILYFESLYDPEEALNCFDMVTKMDSDRSDGWFNKGMVLSRGFEKHQEGLKCLDQATRLDDSNYLAWQEKGRILTEEYNLIDDGMKCYQKALKIEPENGEVLSSMAKAIRLKGELGSAIEHYRKAISVDPANINTYLDLTETCIAMGSLDQAHVTLTSALQIDPRNERVWMLKANVFRQQNEPMKALECYKRVLRFNPDNHDALDRKTSVEAQLERGGENPTV
ncbi:MAG: tetratricopeptide repeat protein [Candidatus Thermoplasmatota archaeon]|nr:tetratricopeptide repeat protein [Candidatus Thermoplasmatota archaeon]